MLDGHQRRALIRVPLLRTGVIWFWRHEFHILLLSRQAPQIDIEYRLAISLSTRSALSSSTTQRFLCSTRVILLGFSLITIFCSGAAGQSPPHDTETEVWPEVDAHVQLPSHFRVLAFSGLEQGVGFPYQQVYAAAGLGYQFKGILKPHLENIDQDKEHYLVFGGGYEFLRTIQSGIGIFT